MPTLIDAWWWTGATVARPDPSARPKMIYIPVSNPRIRLSPRIAGAHIGRFCQQLRRPLTRFDIQRQDGTIAVVHLAIEEELAAEETAPYRGIA
jgi:hypothetical protein